MGHSPRYRATGILRLTPAETVAGWSQAISSTPPQLHTLVFSRPTLRLVRSLPKPILVGALLTGMLSCSTISTPGCRPFVNHQRYYSPG